MNKLKDLRKLMTKHAVDAYLIPRGDEYLGEFVAPYAERLRWLTNFTGSAGHAVILQDTAYVMSDGRYTAQLKQQIDRDHFTPLDSTKHPLKDWLYDTMEEGGCIGFDPFLHSIDQIEELTKRLEVKSITLKPISENLIDQIWQDRPAKPQAKTIPFPDQIAGQTSNEKISKICETLREQGADSAILTLPDSISWLLNIRSNALNYTPVVQTYAHVDVEARKVTMFTNNTFEIAPSDHEADKNRKSQEQKIAMDFLHTPYALKTAGAINIKDPCIPLKAKKTKAEQAAIRAAHVHDGVAMVKFLHWLEQNAIGETEISIADKLESFRREHPAYKGPSFPTIAGFNANGAVIHYRATPETNQTIANNGLLLLDSGGQYLCDDFAGTTDITRTIAIGEVDEAIKRQNTLVLKGHIALAMAHFPSGTNGMQIDTHARQPLWNAGLDYAHGTGHGVGCYGEVHEEAASISPRGKDALEEGMLLSNEPGYYEEGSHGIRIENLVLVQPAGHCTATDKNMLQFETVTLAPIDKSLIVSDLLSEEEKNWLNGYHANVLETLSPLLSGDSQKWLAQACSPLSS